MKILIKIILVVFVLALVASGLGYYWLSNPWLFDPGPYHPMSLYYEHKDVRVHPYLDAGDYQYHLVVWETRWPVSWRHGLGFSEYMQYLAEGFQEIHPNVFVEYRFFPITELPAALEIALAEGSLPDVYAGPFHPGLAELGAVPLDVFIDPVELDLYEPRALAIATSPGGLMAFPRWMEIQGWAGNARFLGEIDPVALAQTGWTWDDARQTLAGAGEALPGQGPPLLMDGWGTDVFRDLMIASGVGSLVSPEGDFLWEGDPLLRVAGFLDNLKEEALLPKSTGSMHDELVVDFMKGRVAVISPGTPGLLRLFKEKTQGEAEGLVDLVFLPVPHPPGGELQVPGRLNAVMALDKGDAARASLSARLALHLSRGPITWLAAEVCGVPAYLPDREEWRAAVGLPEPVIGFMEEAAKNLYVPAPVSARHWKGEALMMEDTIGPLIRHFWLGKLDPAGLEEAIRIKVKGEN